MTAYDAILDALRRGHDKKMDALHEAWFSARPAGSGQHELAMAWQILERDGRIRKTGRTWHVIESEVQP